MRQKFFAGLERDDHSDGEPRAGLCDDNVGRMSIKEGEAKLIPDA